MLTRVHHGECAANSGKFAIRVLIAPALILLRRIHTLVMPLSKPRGPIQSLQAKNMIWLLQSLQLLLKEHATAKLYVY